MQFAGIEADQVFAYLDMFRFELLFGLAIQALWLMGYFAGRTALSSGQRRDRAKLPPAESQLAADGDCAPSTNELLDWSWVASRVPQLAGQHVRQAFRIYRDALEEGLDLAEAPAAEREQVLVALAVSAIRTKSFVHVRELLADLLARGLGLTEELLAQICRSCVSRQFFKECLAIFEAAERDGQLKDLEHRDPTIWSCLLLCAVEMSSEVQGRRFLQNLMTLGPLNAKDFKMAIRFTLLANDCALALELLDQARSNGLEIDAVRCNIVLSLCVSAQEMERARSLLKEMEKDGIADAVAYNTVMKGHVMLRQFGQCFEVRRRMEAEDIEASLVTYAIVLNACVGEGDTQRMSELFEEIVAKKCPLNTVLCTTMIKGFAKAGQPEKVTDVYQYMLKHEEAHPDLITFSLLIKVNCDAARMDGAMQLLDDMKQRGLVPDEVIFNNLMAGCALAKDATLGESIYGKMVRAGVRPSNVSFSILIRLLSECGLLESAVRLLEREPPLHGVVPEPRLYIQLIQACIRQRKGKVAVKVYRDMLERGEPEPADYSKLLRNTLRLNMFDTAADFLELGVTGKVDAADVNALLEVAVRKGKPALRDCCVKAAERLQLRLDASLLGLPRS